MIQVTFSYEPEDVALMTAENTLEGLHASGYRLLLFLGLSTLPATLLLVAYQEWWVLAICWGVIAAGSLCLVILALVLPAAASEGPPLETTFRFTPDALEEASKDYLVRLSWQLIYDLRVTESHLVIDVDSTEWVAPRRFAAVVPLRAFASAEEAEACIAFCRARIEEGKSRAIEPLPPRPDLFPDVFRLAWQGDGLELRYRHADSDAGLLDPDGLAAKRGMTLLASLYSSLLFILFGLGAVAFALQENPSMESSAFAAVVFAGIPFCVLAILQGVHRASAPRQPPALLNPQVLLIIYSQGMYFRTEVSEGFLPSNFVPETDDADDVGEFLFFRAPDGVVGRVLPLSAFRDDDQLRHFLTALDHSRQGIVVAERVNRVAPSDSPYRPPETE